MRRLWMLLLLLLTLSPAFATEQSPRELPSMVVRWRWPNDGHALVVAGDRLVIAGDGRLSAVDLATGRPLWKAPAADAMQYDTHLAVDGDRLLAGTRERLILINVLTGEIKKTISPGGLVQHVFPGFVAEVSTEEGVELLSVDPASGEIAARNHLTLQAMDAAAEKGVVALIVDPGRKEYGDYTVRAFDVATLAPRWTIDPVSSIEFQRREGGLWIETDGLRRLDMESGRLGPALPPKPECGFSSSSLPWDIDLMEMADDQRSSTIRRNDPSSGHARWLAKLPCVANKTLLRDNVLFVDCGRGGGRDLFLYLDWSSGVVQREQYGLAGVNAIEFRDDMLLIATDHEVVAISPTDSGPPESKTVSLESEVRRILSSKDGDSSPFGRGDFISGRVTDLEALGPAALPLVAAEIPSLGTTSLIAAAELAIRAGYRAAAEPLVRRLAGELERPRGGWPRWNPRFVLIDAVSVLGDATSAGTILPFLRDRSEHSEVRREAFCALVRLGAVENVRAFLQAERQKKRALWKPPSVDGFSALIGEMPKKRADGTFNPEEMGPWFAAARSLRVPYGDGSLVIFADAFLGADDVWIAQLDKGGRQHGSSLFAGSIAGLGRAAFPSPGLDDEVVAVPFAASAAGNLVDIWLTANPTARLRVRLADLARDSDGDGIPDLVERRLGTDPLRRDTGGDGIDDSHDAAPTHAPASAGGGGIEEAIFTQFFLFDASTEPAVLVTGHQGDWWGRSGLTLVKSAKEAEAMQSKLGNDGIAYISIAPARGDDGGQRSLSANERLYTLDIWRGPLDAQFYRVVVRKIGTEWFLTDVELAAVA